MVAINTEVKLQRCCCMTVSGGRFVWLASLGTFVKASTDAPKFRLCNADLNDYFILLHHQSHSSSLLVESIT